jgi:hypothetical protein
MALRRGLAAILFGACVLAPMSAVRAQGAERPREALVKAAFLHKFFSFVEWPEGTFARPDTPVRIGVIGDDEVWQDLLELSKDRVRDGRPVTPVRLLPGESLSGVHILYIRSPSPARITEILAAAPPGILTVADADSAFAKGSVVSFFVEDGRVRFGISMQAAAHQGLRLSSRLLSVARKIQGSIDLLGPVALAY